MFDGEEQVLHLIERIVASPARQSTRASHDHGSAGRLRSRAHELIVSGGTGSGKTTLPNVLSSFALPSERLITIEDAARFACRSRT